MTPEEREQVVEILRCAADVAALGLDNPITLAYDWLDADWSGDAVTRSLDALGRRRPGRTGHLRQLHWRQAVSIGLAIVFIACLVASRLVERGAQDERLGRLGEGRRP